MTADELVSRLEKTKRTGRGSWLACCPAHNDKNPSLTVREVDDGRILIHCFAGCNVYEITSAIGVELHELFPDRPSGLAGPVRRPFPAADVLKAVEAQTFYVAYMAAGMAGGYVLEPRDKALLEESAAHLMEARRLALGER